MRDKKIQCLIVDDEPIAHTILKQYIEKDERLELAGNCSNAMQALQYLQSGKPVDLIFLDIRMPKISGLEFLRSLRNPPQIIITTANREYALESFDLNVADYLLKPFSFERFLQGVNKVVALLATQKPIFSIESESEPQENFIVIKVDGKLIKLEYDEILFVEAWKEYIKVHTDGKFHITLLSLSAIEEKLPAGIFVRTHRSYIVNISKIDNVEGNTIHIGNTEVPISRNEREKFMEKFMRK